MRKLLIPVAAVALFGTAIGLRFSVYILIPAGLAALIATVVAQLVSNKMAGWGVQGTIGLLMLLNAGFALGLFLRAAAAIWSTKRIARLFARPGNLDHQVRRPDGAGREASRRMRADGCNNAPRLGKREFPSITLSAVPCRIFSANPETPAVLLSTIDAML